MNINTLIEQVRKGLTAKLSERADHKKVIDDVREACANDDQRDPSEEEATKVRGAQESIRKLDPEIDQLREKLAEYEAEKERDEAMDRLSREIQPSGANLPGGPEERVKVGSEPRTYAREVDPKGVHFLRDVASSALGDAAAQGRLSQHMQEERVERGGLDERAVGTGAFTGLVVPQYLTDMFAPASKAGRPFADACRHHDLPAQGMVVNIGKLTTATSTDLQSSEGLAVDETNADDTLLSINVQTNAGQQTVSRQAAERGAGIEDTLLEDLFRSYGTTLDSTLLNQSSTGLTNVATSVAYTDSTPTAAELYPKVMAGAAAVEAALLDQDPGDTIAVMHSRRWYWLQSQLSSTWPLFGQPGLAVQQGGVNYGERYGSGFRGILPNGVPVVVDNNIATNLGTGTNEDEVYITSQSESHLWEDPNAPMFIRADQTKAANLQILLVVYGYFAYTFTRRAHAQKIAGTGLVAPTF